MTVDLFGHKVDPRQALGAHESPSGGKDEWLTPPYITGALGPFDLDPCSPINRPWPTATTHYTIADDGLRQAWEGFIWCNPPYAHVAKWMAKMAGHNNGIALLFARTETKAWQDHIWPYASSVLFIRGRLEFHHVNGKPAGSNAGAPSALIGYGPEADRRLATNKHLGHFIQLAQERSQK